MDSFYSNGDVTQGALDHFRPVDQGYKAWSADPAFMSATIQVTGGTVYVMRVPLPESFSCTGIDVCTTSAGSGLTYARATIHGEDRVTLVTSDDQTTNWQASPGVKTATVAATALTGGPGRFCFVSLLSTGTTQPTFSRTGTFSANLINAGLTASNFRTATGGTSQVAIPGTPTLTSNTFVIWVGLK